MFKTHYFDSTGRAYDASQTGYRRFVTPPGAQPNDMFTEHVECEVADGDLMVIPKEGVYGFLYEAWPVAVDPKHHRGEFQGLSATFWDVKEHVDKYGEVYRAALLLNELHHSTIDPKRYVKGEDDHGKFGYVDEDGDLHYMGGVLIAGEDF